MLDPWLNSKTVVSSGNDFSVGTDCYYQFFQNPLYMAGYKPDKSLTYYDYQIDVNITVMEGVVATIHNGTSLFTAQDSLEVNFDGGQRKFTFNASSPYFNNVFIKFSADTELTGQPVFSVAVGLRPEEIEDEDEDDADADDDDDTPFYPRDVIPISKELTFNEEVIMLIVMFGICAMCCKNRFCYEGFDCRCCCHMCKRIPSEKDFVEKEFFYKVKEKKQGFDVNLGDQAHGEEDEVQETNISEDFEDRDVSM